MSSFSFDYNDIPAGYYDRVAREGPALQRSWHQFKFRSVIDEVRKLPGLLDGGHVVDLGCGPGTLLGMLAHSLPITGVGIDVSRTQIEYANRQYGSERLRFLALSIDSSEAIDVVAAADAVVLVEVIEHLHLRYVHRVLGQLHDAMKPGTVCMVTTPNYLSYWPLLERAIGFLSEVTYEEQHVLHFNRIKLRNVLATAGFVKIEVRSFQQLSPFIAAAAGDWVGGLARMAENRWLRHGGPLLFGLGVKG